GLAVGGAGRGGAGPGAAGRGGVIGGQRGVAVGVGSQIRRRLLLAHPQPPVRRRLEQRDEFRHARGEEAVVEPIADRGLQLGVSSDAHAVISVPRPEERALSAFTRVHSPSKTGVNALKDALWPASRRTAGGACGGASRRGAAAPLLSMRPSAWLGSL